MPRRKHSRDDPPHPVPAVSPDDPQPFDDAQGVDVEPAAAEPSSERVDEQGASLDAPHEAIEHSEKAEADEQGDARGVGPQGVDALEVGFYGAGELVRIAEFGNVTRALQAFVERPAVARGLEIPKAG